LEVKKGIEKEEDQERNGRNSFKAQAEAQRLMHG
jgi:hypothetical protein